MSLPHVYQRVIDLAPEMQLVIRARDGSASDSAAVATTLKSLGEAEVKRTTIDVDALADAIIASHRREPTQRVSDAVGLDPGDLITAGLALVVAAVCNST